VIILPSKSLPRLKLTGDNRNSRLATFRIPDPTTK